MSTNCLLAHAGGMRLKNDVNGSAKFPANLKFGLRLRTCFSWSMVWPSCGLGMYASPSNALALAVRWCLLVSSKSASSWEYSK